MADANFPLSTVDSDGLLTPRGGLGGDYESARDLLYVSFCQAGCASFGMGLSAFRSSISASSLIADGRPMPRVNATGGIASARSTRTAWPTSWQVSTGKDPIDGNIFVVPKSQNFDLAESFQWETGLKALVPGSARRMDVRVLRHHPQEHADPDHVE